MSNISKVKVISGISKSIDGNALEEVVLNLFSKVNTPVDPSHIEDWHCLISTNNAPQKVVVKLSKENHLYQVLKAKSILTNVDLLELKYLLALLYLSTKVSADITHFYGLKPRSLGFDRLVSSKLGWQISQGYSPYRRFKVNLA